MAEDANELVLRLHYQEIERLRGKPLDRSEPSVLPPTELPEGDPNSPIAAEWELFRQEVGRLIHEGNQGRVALIKDGHPITIWDTIPDAVHAGRLLYGQQPCLVQEIVPFLRPVRVGYNRPCRD